MKIKKIINIKSPLIKLKLLQAKNYKKIYLMKKFNIKDIQYRLIKSLKILYKYIFKNKIILFINKVLTINVTLKRLLTRTKYIYTSNIIKSKNCLKSDLSLILIEKTNMSILKQFHKIKTPVFLITNDFVFKNVIFSGTSYRILGNLLLKKNQHFLFFIFLYSILLKKQKFINLKIYDFKKKK
jgi:hypothetical protein